MSVGAGLGRQASGGGCGLTGIPSRGLSYHGFVGVPAALELQRPVGICGVALGVFANTPFFGLSLHLFVYLPTFAGCHAWQRGNMLVGELATATPEITGKSESFCNISSP